MTAAQTPRTDLLERTTLNPADLLALCRELERELAAANEERDTTATDLRDELGAAKAEVEKERKRAGLWVKAARDLARELGLADEYSKASHRDWDLIVKKAREAEALREKCVRLWKLLDHIDTLDDAIKQNDAEFRKAVYATQRKRFAIMCGDEFDAARKG